MASRSIDVVSVRVSGGRAFVRFPGKREIEATAAEANAIVDAADAAITPELIAILGAKKVGFANVATLAGQTITVEFSVTVAPTP